MQTRSGWLPRSLFVFTILVSLSAGCASRGTPTTGYPNRGTPTTGYPDAYKALMVSYRGRMKELAARPMPPASMPKEQRRAAIARQIDDLADTYTGYGTRLDALQAPASMREIQSTTHAFFKVSAEDSHRWAEAIRHGDSKTADQVEHQGEVDELAAMRHMQQALKRIGGTSQKLQKVIDEQQRSVNK